MTYWRSYCLRSRSRSKSKPNKDTETQILAGILHPVSTIAGYGKREKRSLQPDKKERCGDPFGKI